MAKYQLFEDDFIHLIESSMRGGEILKRIKRFFSLVVAFLLTLFTFMSYMPAKTASAAGVPKIQFASPPITQYQAGDRVNFNIYAPNYGGKVQYRVVLWNDTKKTYYDLWNASNGYPERYYTKWQPYGNNIFTLGWIIFDPGSYRITIYAKRAGISNSKTALKGLNCDSFMESAAFVVKSKEATVESILPVSDVTVMQGGTPILPTKVRAAMSDGLEKEFGVTWAAVNTSNPGNYTIEGTVSGTTKKAYVKVNVTAQTAINVSSVVSVGNYLVNVILRDAISSTPDASKFSIKSYNSNTIVPIQSVSLSADKKTVALTTGYLATNSWYTLTVNNSSINFIGNQGNSSGISLSAQNKEVAVNGTVYATVNKSPSDVILTYYSSNTTIATVDQNTGLITGRYPGVVTITVNGNKSGYSQASTTFTVTVGGQNGIYANAQNMQIAVGTQQMPVITKYPYDMTLYFSSSNTSVATVNYSTGMVTGVSQGTATITITGYYNGYNNVTSQFTVTVGYQGAAITVSPTILSESSNNDGSLTSGVIDVYLTGSTFVNWSSYNYYEDYVKVYNLPYGMSYSVAYVNSTRLRVTLTGRAYSHGSADKENIRIIIAKDLVYGANYDLSSSNVLLDFTDYPIPAAPTNPVVDDTNNTFGWMNVSGFGSASDYEYSVDNGSHWADCNANPQLVGDNNFPSGTVKVRVKAATGRSAGYALASNKAFTKSNDASAPVLKGLTIKFIKDEDGIYNILPDNGGNYNTPPVLKGKEITGLEIRVEDTNLNTSPVYIYDANTSTKFGTLKYNGGLWKLDMATCQFTKLNSSVNLTATFTDGTNNTRAKINISVVEIKELKDLSETIVEGSTYTMPTKAEAVMSDNSKRWFNVTSWDKVIDPTKPGVQVAIGTIAEDATKTVKLTVTVTSTATIVRIPDTFDTVDEGAEYVMPKQVVAYMSDGQQKLVNVAWDPKTLIDTSKPEEQTAFGKVDGWNKDVKLIVTVKPVTIIKINDITKWAKLGEPFVMPTKVEAQMSNGTVRNVDVIWVPLTIDTKVPGIYEAFGTVAGYDKKVKLTVIVSDTKPESKKLNK